MAKRPLASGSGTITILSRRPGRTSAASRHSGRFVAAMRTTGGPSSSLELKPSSSQSSWFNVCSRSSFWPKRSRVFAMASTSSMNTMHGATLRARSKRSRTRAAPRPTRTSTKADAEQERKGTPASPATAAARSVLPVPEGPVSSTPRGHLAPTEARRSGNFMARTTSSSSRSAESTPATRAKPDSSSALSRFFFGSLNLFATEASRGPLWARMRRW
mmetsp:Transcript_10389/g.34391  ORF Transcript_10389/g.34391 Transcript_10389/m.34391 type:complete len:217 (+) Transcript_10389:363-1013(+)